MLKASLRGEVCKYIVTEKWVIGKFFDLIHRIIIVSYFLGEQYPKDMFSLSIGRMERKKQANEMLTFDSSWPLIPHLF